MSYIEISSGVYLQDRNSIIAAQKDWNESDESKRLDFTTHPFWITTDCGAMPVGFNSIKEIVEEYWA